MRQILVLLIYLPAMLTGLRSAPAVHAAKMESRGLGSQTRSSASSPAPERGSPEIRVRILRVIERINNLAYTWILLEDVQHGRFQERSYCGPGSRSSLADRRRSDLSDAWNALNDLRVPPAVARLDIWFDDPSDSIDAAIDRGKAKHREAMEWVRERFRRSKTPKPSAEEQDSDSRPMLVARTGGAGPEPQLDEVRAYDKLREMAATGDLGWKSLEPTQAGHRCEVLIFHGQEEISVPVSL